MERRTDAPRVARLGPAEPPPQLRMKQLAPVKTLCYQYIP